MKAYLVILSVLLFFPALLFSQSDSNSPLKDSVISTPEYCSCPQHSSILSDLTRFVPNENTPEITLRANFIFMQKNDGLGGFDKHNPVHQNFWREVIGSPTESWSSLNHILANLENEDNGKSCYDGYVADSRIQFKVNHVFIRDSYGWNNENDKCSANCPDLRGCDWYLNYLHNKITEDSTIPSGINVFFTEKSTAYDTIVTLNKLKISLINSHACSMMPDCNPNRNLKCHMPDAFLSFYSKSLIPSSPEWDTSLFWNPYDRSTRYDNNTYNWAVDKTAFSISHELGHNLGLGHGYNHCHNNIMNNGDGAKRTYLQLKQLGQVHKNLCTTSLRNYIEGCPYSAYNIFEVTGDELIDFDFTWYGNIVVKSGGTLTITCTVRMPDNAKIIVERGARLIVSGGRITSACAGKWQGIQVIGNSERANKKSLKKEHPQNISEIYDFNLNSRGSYPKTPDEHGVVILNKAIVENASCGISTGNKSMINEKKYTGGILLAEKSVFRNNDLAIKILKFNYKPTDQSSSYYIRECTFETDDPAIEEKPDSFIQMSGICGSQVSDNIFINRTK